VKDDSLLGEEDKRACSKLSAMITEQSLSNLEHIKIVFGPENSYFARWKDGVLWHNLPKTLVAQLKQREESKTPIPRIIALGSNGTWFAIWGKQDMVYDLKGQYKSMRETIQTSSPKNIEVSQIDFLREPTAMTCNL
jgi:hypothetical protein